MSGLVGVYGVMSNEAFYGNYYSLMCSNVDDLSYFNRSTTSNYTNMYKHDASATEIYAAWTEIYKGIRNANAFMEAIPATEFDKDGKLYNEARFLRAYYHFILAQAWGDVPMRKQAVTSHDKVMCAASPQFEVLTWATEEMEACIELAGEDLSNSPSRINKYIVHGILSRAYLFMAGESVNGGDKKDFYKKAMEHADVVIKSGKFQLNPEYSQVFINMISDEYDREREKVEYERYLQSSLMPCEKNCDCRMEESPLPRSHWRKQSVPEFGSVGSIEKFMYKGFRDTLLDFVNKKGVSDVECYKRANVSRQTWHKIVSDRWFCPKKTTVIALAISLQLNIDETQELLASAGFILSKSSLFDVIIMFCIVKGIYDVFEIDTILFQYDQKTLFSAE